MRVELDLSVTSLLGTVVIRRHLGGQQLCAHFHRDLPEHAASHVGSTFRSHCFV
jgi:hypothetical protein